MFVQWEPMRLTGLYRTRKDFILFQLQVALAEAETTVTGNQVVNQVAESIA